VDLPTVLLRDLMQLSSHLDLDDDALTGPLVSLVESLQAAVPSYRALHLTIVDIDRPVSLTALMPHHDIDSITTSLRIGFAALGPGFDSRSRVVFYAATPGAFVDLAADFSYALDTPGSRIGTPIGSTDRTGPRRNSPDQPDGDRVRDPACRDGDGLMVLDADLPLPTAMSGLVGLDELSMINRAVGILIDQGHHPNRAHAALLSGAVAAGVSPPIYAARLLRR
jgi:hypothetical protein